MNKKNGFYSKLALQNIQKNGKFYFSYLLTCIFTVAMYYIMGGVTYNDSLVKMPRFTALLLILKFGTSIIGIFAVVFLFYTNSFLMKRRKKEFGLYNILGMEKKHICLVLFWETVYIGAGGVFAGILMGILLNKLLLLILGKLIRLDFTMDASISWISVRNTCILFAAIFFIILVYHMFCVGKTKPIDLLRGSNVGEREPKAKWFLALAGLVLVGIGYYISITTTNPIEALVSFFVAVLCVVCGTYLLFTAGSIAVLKLMKKNKKFYYQTKHFTSVSGMMYRMKQNAVGLSNICILITMVLVSFSASVCLYIGADRMLDDNYPYDYEIQINGNTKKLNREEIKRVVGENLKSFALEKKEDDETEWGTCMVKVKGNQLQCLGGAQEVDMKHLNMLYVAPLDIYEKMEGKSGVSLEEDQALLWTNGEAASELRVFGTNVKIVKQLEKFPESIDRNASYYEEMCTVYYLVVKDMQTFYQLMEDSENIYYAYRFNYGAGDKDTKLEFEDKLKEQLHKQFGKKFMVSYNSKIESREDYFSIYGGFMFLGTFLAMLFLMAAVLIIYYKQISEGYEDKEKFAIMKKVGMTTKEIKETIGSQVVFIFFLPLLVACIHVAAAFPLIRRLLLMFGLTNVTLFVLCTVGSILVFGILYGIVYRVTARMYYHIVVDMRK